MKKSQKTAGSVKEPASKKAEQPVHPGLVFPCDFPIKIMGPNTQEFHAEIMTIIKTHYPAIPDQNIKHALSKNGNFISISFKVYATNKAELDALYLEVTAHSDVKMVL